MSLVTDIMERLRALVSHTRDDRELDEELRFHLERDVAERVRRGVSPDRARREAQLALGNIEHQKEEVRDARGTRAFQELAADVRQAIRGLTRNPAYALTGILVLALGLGATTAVFSVMDSVVFARLPYPHPDQLVRVIERSGQGQWALSTADVSAIREQQRSFSAWGSAQRSEVALSVTGEPERVAIGRVDAGFLSAVGVKVAVGRNLAPADESLASPAVVILSQVLAQRLFGGPRDAIGQSLNLDGVSHAVVGVLPAGRNELGGLVASAWPALKLPAIKRRGPFWLRGVGRLKPGVTIDAASRDLATISARMLPLYPDFRDSTAKLTPLSLRDTIVGRANHQIALFGGAVLLVLLLAITNVTTLALVRANAREPELTLRVMLGAQRGRIVRLLLTESLVLTLAAGVVGLALAMGGIKLAITQLPDLPRIHEAALDWRAAGVALAASIASGFLVSVSPLLTLAGKATNRLQTDGRRVGTARSTNTLRGILVGTEFALALPLLVGAGVLLNSLVRLQRVDLGFAPDGVVAIGIALPTARYSDPESLGRFQQRAEQRLVEMYGAERVGVATNIPPDNSGNNDNFNLVDHPVPAGQAEPASPWYYVTSGYFSALGVRLLSGRLFTLADTGDAEPAIVVSQSWARRYLPGEAAVGQKLVQGGCYDCPRTTIVGVVGDIRNLGPAGETEAVYGPLTQSNARAMFLVARSRTGTAATLREMRDAVRSLDPQLPIEEAVISQRFADALADPQRWAAVLAAFASVAMLLSALGVFGLMSYVVRQRRREIGVRLALGARPAEITWLVVARGMRYAVLGSVIGLVITIALAQRVQSLLFEVSALDVRTLVSVAVLLLASAFAACWLPGRRAGRIKPLEAISAD